uniref:Uncharacterized protein n=1 Tax=Alexandrium catenella TaxID=2925 RepID=A0A7S1QTK5_ALECA
MGLFGYNRGNYMMDQKLHFSRFTAGLNMAIAQTGMYRQDITQLTNLTCTRMDVYHSIAAMTATILTALFCPGRLGLHTPPPPGWLMGLFMVNLAGTYLWLGLTMWLCMHASLRADTALTHMLTRFVRLPIPAQCQIDRARKYLASYEEQPLREAFRVPFMRHQYGGSKTEGPYNEEMEIDPDAESRTRHGFDVPAWYRKEKAIDNSEAMETMMPFNARGTAPEHFEVYREIQNEWWPYDVYARLSIFLAFMHLTHCWTYMQIGHHLTETRSVFALACVVLPMTVLQQIILTLDIIPGKGEIPIQRLGPFAMWFAYVAAVLEYKRWFTTSGLVASFVLVYIAYGIHVIYTLQLLRLCSPDMTKPPVPAEAAGSSWWPGSWCLPSAFQHAIWLVAPPQHLEPGQNDIAGEIRAASREGAGSGTAVAAAGGLTAEAVLPAHSAKRQDVHRALGRQGESPAWFNVRTGLIAMLVAWLYLILGYSIEVVNQGTAHPSLISAPGMPNNARDPRYRPAKPGGAEPVEVGTGGAVAGPAVGMHEEAVERRLHEFGFAPEQFKVGGKGNAAVRREVVEKVLSLLPHLQELARGERRAAAAEPVAFWSAPNTAALLTASAPNRATVQWPAFFEPRVLACGPASVHGEEDKVAITLSRHGRGAVVKIKASGAPAELLQFALEGVTGAGPLIAAAWDELGLLLTSATGATMECPGKGPANGRWRCQPVHGAKLPIGLGGRHFTGAAAISRHPKQDGLRAAIVHPGGSTMTVLSRSSREMAPWLPAGEVRTTGVPGALAFAEEHAILLEQVGGAVSRIYMADGAMTTESASVPSDEGHSWQAACGLPAGGIVRLGLRPTKGMAMEPELFLA